MRSQLVLIALLVVAAVCLVQAQNDPSQSGQSNPNCPIRRTIQTLRDAMGQASQQVSQMMQNLQQRSPNLQQQGQKLMNRLSQQQDLSSK